MSEPGDLINCLIYHGPGHAFTVRIARQDIASLDEQIRIAVKQPAIFEATPNGGLPCRIPGKHITAWIFMDPMTSPRDPMEILRDLQIQLVKAQIEELKNGEEWKGRGE